MSRLHRENIFNIYIHSFKAVKFIKTKAIGYALQMFKNSEKEYFMQTYSAEHRLYEH